MIHLDGATPEDEVAAFVDEIRRRPERRDELVELLPQGHPLYTSRGANQTVRIRGYVLASFEALGLPESALPYVLEELENSQKPYLVAASAKALRGLSEPPAEVAGFLVAAITNVQYKDDALSFETYKPAWPLASHTTAIEEVLATLGSLGARARSALPTLRGMQSNPMWSSRTQERIGHAVQAIESDSGSAAAACCSMPSAKREAARTSGTPGDPAQVAEVVFEDQDGENATYAEIFRGKPTVAAFFYTRCGNPNKCSLTVTKLGQLQEAIAKLGKSGRVRVAAVTYDPGHDTPERLRGYCQNRGLRFDDDHRAWRADPGRFEAVRDFFELGANFSGTVVSRHHIELYLLDGEGQITTRYANLQWSVDEVAAESIALAERESQPELAAKDAVEPTGTCNQPGDEGPTASPGPGRAGG